MLGLGFCETESEDLAILREAPRVETLDRLDERSVALGKCATACCRFCRFRGASSLAPDDAVGAITEDDLTSLDGDPVVSLSWTLVRSTPARLWNGLEEAVEGLAFVSGGAGLTSL